MRAARPSSTARLILRSLLLSARHPAYCRLVPVGDDIRLGRMLEQLGRAAWFDFALRHEWAAHWLWRLEDAILPGIVLHYLARKRWLERVVVRALGAGVRQIVVLGAGFDTLAWRLHRDWPEVFFCELDHPATQSPKTAALASAEPGANLALQPADLGSVLPSALLRQQPRFDPHQHTFFVAEGLLMYFSAERVRALLHDLAGFPGAACAFSFMAPGPDGHAAFRGGRTLIDAWLRLVSEPFAWAIAPAQLAGFVRDAGWHLGVMAGAAELRTKILAPAGLALAPLAEGEFLCHATVLP